MTAGEELLDASLLTKLERLQMANRRRLAGSLSGEHASTRRGSSLDFADYRQYHPGDDFRRIDYHLLARLDVLLIKLFEAEDELTVRLLVDRSSSMAIGGKLEQARRVAGAFGFVALVRRDPVALHVFPPSAPGGGGRRFTGRAATADLFRQLLALEAGGTTDVVPAVADLLARPGPPGLTLLVSDLLTPEWEQAISRLPARGGDLLVVHVLAAEDLRPTVSGDVELVDRETDARVAVSMAPETLAGYERSASAWLARVEGRCHQLGAGYLRVMADEPLEPLLLSAWRRAGALR